MASVVRPIDPTADAELELVAERMRLTLIEVLGRDVGAEMYSMDWLRARARWHLDPAQCRGAIFVVEEELLIVGHTIVRVEDGAGLFSTIYVVPESRGRGHAKALLLRGEAWLASEGMKVLATNTSETNAPLIALFGAHGYEIVLSIAEKRMIRLEKAI